MKTLIVYFSYNPGNTKRIAEEVHAAIGGDIVRLHTVVPYSSDYNTVVEQAQNEVDRDYKPELKPLGVNIKDYDRIIVGTPTWWYKMASPVLTFLSDNDFTGKIVVPFQTDAGWPREVLEDMSRIARENGATVEHPHAFRFGSDPDDQSRMVTPQSELTQWIDSLK